MIKILLVVLGVVCSAEAASLRLQNESLCPLKAVIIGADGAVLNEIVVQGKSQTIWNEGMIKTQISLQSPAKSQTPFTVHWMCLNGDTFGLSDGLSTGSLASTGQCLGPKNCKEETAEGKNP